jgi:excisionase family DNA binding protein
MSRQLQDSTGGDRFERTSQPSADQLRSTEPFASATLKVNDHAPDSSDLPITVKEAARFLGVSPQTVYLWVERKQIPHLRVMGRNIRFLKSDLEPFRATFKQEVGIGKIE